MATSGGHLLVPKALRAIRFAVEKTSRLIRDKLPQASRAVEAQAEPIYIRITPREPVKRAIAIKQSQSRWYSTRQAIRSTIRGFSSGPQEASRGGRSAFPTSRTSQAVSRLTGRTPFATTLRPNLTGGTLCRSAGGYGNGAGRIGGARYFSHSPAAHAQVVNNVSQAVRAFWLSGQKAHFDGMSPRSGEKQFKVVTSLQDETGRKIRAARPEVPGSYVDFKVTPSITAVGPLSSVPRAGNVDQEQATLNSEGFMDVLSIDFARALKDLALVMNDLNRLSALGDLPISLADSSTLRIRFPGCDAESVERLCLELGITRGMVYQDFDFDNALGSTEMALLFPFAPGESPSEATYSPNVRPIHPSKQDAFEWQEMLSARQWYTPGHSHDSVLNDTKKVEVAQANPWLSSPSGYSSLSGSEHEDVEMYFASNPRDSMQQSSEFEELEGIYKFLEECDRARR